MPGAPVPPPPPAPPAPKAVGALTWTPQSTLLFRDSNGSWQEANPQLNQVSPLPSALQGTVGINFAPDGRQVLYYKGETLYTAQRDGSKPIVVGRALVGHWGTDGKLITTKAVQPGTPPSPEKNLPGLGKQ